jgi:hypothetical protein
VTVAKSKSGDRKPKPAPARKRPAAAASKRPAKGASQAHERERVVSSGAGDKLMERLRASELALLVERGGRLAFASDRPGFRPLFRAVLEHAELFEGADVGCLAIGLSTAYLFAHARVARVATSVLSKEGERALQDAGIAIAAGERVKAFVAPKPVKGAAVETREAIEAELNELDQLARDAGTVGRFVDELRQRFA